MTNMARRILVAASILPLLAGCGLRGGLERADPVFKDIAPVEDVVEPAPQVEVRVRPRTNNVGGELPRPAPSDDVRSSPLPDLPENQ